MIISDVFDLIDTFDWDINEILEESNYCLQRRSEMIEYNNPICKRIKVRNIDGGKIYTFQIYEDK